jgi:uracil-DNA glycosylase
MRLVPERDWTFFGPAMVLHGRYTCTARAPGCGACVLAPECRKLLEPGVEPAAGGGGGDAPVTRASVKGSKPEAKAMGSTKEKAGTKAGVDAGAKGAAGDGEGLPPLPASWRPVLAEELAKPYFAELSRFVGDERRAHTVFPPRDEVFSALELTPYEDVNVLLLGQDPYHDDGQAHGLCFSVRPGVPPPPSLVNIFKELEADLGQTPPKSGYLAPWAEQGVLLLNAVLTVRAHEPNSHDKRDPVVFVLWGGYAQKKAKLVDASRHTVIASAHPSPLSARNGFFGSRPFSKINEALARAGKRPISFRLPS